MLLTQTLGKAVGNLGKAVEEQPKIFAAMLDEHEAKERANIHDLIVSTVKEELAAKTDKAPPLSSEQSNIVAALSLTIMDQRFLEVFLANLNKINATNSASQTNDDNSSSSPTTPLANEISSENEQPSSKVSKTSKKAVPLIIV